MRLKLCYKVIREKKCAITTLTSLSNIYEQCTAILLA